MTEGNEGRCCDAVVRVLERRLKTARAGWHVPDRSDSTSQRVDVCIRIGANRYALEHTRIDPFEDAVTVGMDFSRFVTPIKERFSDVLPGPAYYTLLLPQDHRIGLSGRNRGRKRARAQKTLGDWIAVEAPLLYDRALASGLDRGFESAALESTDNIPYPVRLVCTLTRNLAGAEKGRFSVSRIPDDRLDEQRYERLRRALADKCPKLQRCKDRGARTVLILEDDDIALSDSVVVRESLHSALIGWNDIPDEIYLVQTKFESWRVFPMNPAADSLFPRDSEMECKTFDMEELEDMMSEGFPASRCEICRDQ